jgi:hypothetical protein
VKFCVCFRCGELSGGTNLLVLPLSFVVHNVVRIRSSSKCGSYVFGKAAEMFVVQYTTFPLLFFCSSMESPCPTSRN